MIVSAGQVGRSALQKLFKTGDAGLNHNISISITLWCFQNCC